MSLIPDEFMALTLAEIEQRMTEAEGHERPTSTTIPLSKEASLVLETIALRHDRSIDYVVMRLVEWWARNYISDCQKAVTLIPAPPTRRSDGRRAGRWTPAGAGAR